MANRYRFPILSVRALLTMITTVAVLPALAIIVWIGQEYSRTLEDQARNEVIRQVEAFAEIQMRLNGSVRQMLATVATQVGHLGNDAELLQAVLNTLRSQNPDLINVSLTDAQGRVTSSALLPIGTDLSYRKHIRAAIAGEGFAVGEFVLANVGNEPALPFAHTIRNPAGKIIGAVATVFRLTSYPEYFMKSALPEQTIFAILDHQGRRLFFFPPLQTNPVGGMIQPAMWKVISSVGALGVTPMTGSDGVRRLYAHRAVYVDETDGPALYLVIGIPERYATVRAREALAQSIRLMIAAAVVAMALALVLGELVIGRALTQLGATATALRTGALNARTGIPLGGSEIARVAQTLDEMAESLERRIREREAAERTAREALKVKETLLREIHHRVKNNLQLILSLLRLAGTSGGPETATFQRVEHRINAMALVHEILYQSDNLGAIQTNEYIPRLVHLALESFQRGETARLDLSIDTATIPIDQAVPFALIVNELVTNACKYGLDQTNQLHLAVTLRVDPPSTAERCMTLTIADGGPGLPAGRTPESSGSLGMTLIEALTTQLRGTLSSASNHTHRTALNGASFQVRFPYTTHPEGDTPPQLR